MLPNDLSAAVILHAKLETSTERGGGGICRMQDYIVFGAMVRV